MSNRQDEHERIRDDVEDCPNCDVFESPDGELCDEHERELDELTPMYWSTPKTLQTSMPTDGLQQRRQNRTAVAVAIVLGVSLGGLSAVYLSRYFSGWPAKVAGGAFIWVLLSITLVVAIVAALEQRGVVEIDE